MRTPITSKEAGGFERSGASDDGLCMQAKEGFSEVGNG